MGSDERGGRSKSVSAFLNRLCLEVADNQDDGQWILARPLMYASDVAGRTFIVPRGFRTDLASVPRLPIIFWLTGASSNEAACIHDFLYSTHEVDRATADAVLREASAVTGVPAWRRWLMYWGVRIWGGSHWKLVPSEA
jgi:hypothetical protein